MPYTAGREYMDGAIEKTAALAKATLFPADQRRAIYAAFAIDAGVQPPAITSANQILAWPLWTQSKGVLLLANLSLDHPRMNAWLRHYAGRVLRAIGTLRVQFAALIVGAAWSAVAVLLIGGCLALLSGGGSAGLGVAQGLAVAAPIILATSLPISIAGWGVREIVVVEKSHEFRATHE